MDRQIEIRVKHPERGQIGNYFAVWHELGPVRVVTYKFQPNTTVSDVRLALQTMGRALSEVPHVLLAIPDGATIEVYEATS